MSDLSYSVDENGIPMPSTSWPKAQTPERAYVCAVCRRGYRQSETVIFRGKRYGIPCGDNLEVKGILRSERSGRERPRSGEEMRESFEIGGS